MRKTLYISILFIFGCCKPEGKPPKISYYPSKDAFENPDFLIPIDLDTTSLKYGDLLAMTPAIDYRKNVPFFEIKKDSVTKRIVPFLLNYPHVKRDELITITMDSVIADKRYSIADLDEVMKNIFGNQKTSIFYDYKKNPEAVRLAIDIDPKSSGRDLKKILLITTDAFDKLKNQAPDSLYLTICFDNLYSLYPQLQ